MVMHNTDKSDQRVAPTVTSELNAFGQLQVVPPTDIA
jgi:hypothetical protein